MDGRQVEEHAAYVRETAPRLTDVTNLTVISFCFLERAISPSFSTRRKKRMNSMEAWRKSPLQGVCRDAIGSCCAGDAWGWLWRQIELEHQRPVVAAKDKQKL